MAATATLHTVKISPPEPVDTIGGATNDLFKRGDTKRFNLTANTTRGHSRPAIMMQYRYTQSRKIIFYLSSSGSALFVEQIIALHIGFGNLSTILSSQAL